MPSDEVERRVQRLHADLEMARAHSATGRRSPIPQRISGIDSSSGHALPHSGPLLERRSATLPQPRTRSHRAGVRWRAGAILVRAVQVAEEQPGRRGSVGDGGAARLAATRRSSSSPSGTLKRAEDDITMLRSARRSTRPTAASSFVLLALASLSRFWCMPGRLCDYMRDQRPRAPLDPARKVSTEPLRNSRRQRRHDDLVVSVGVPLLHHRNHRIAIADDTVDFQPKLAHERDSLVDLFRGGSPTATKRCGRHDERKCDRGSRRPILKRL